MNSREMSLLFVFYLLSIKDVHGVQVLQGHQDVGGVELSGVLLKTPNLTQVEEKLTTWAVLKAKVEFAFSLESIVHFDDELVIYTLLLNRN